MAQAAFLAVDMGASSGRHVVGLFDGGRLSLEELYRFDNGPVHAAGRMYWDALRQWEHVVAGLQAAGRFAAELRSVGVDTWGVDFALLGRDDELLGSPRHYRDARTAGMLERAFEIVPRADIYAATGVQLMQINTLYQLLAMRLARSSVLDAAESLLLMPDFFHWLLTGEKANEFTNATTTQFYDPTRRTWAKGLFERLGLPTKILGRLTPPGTKLGPLLPAVAQATGLGKVQVVLPGTHDTASAVLAVPADSGQPSSTPDWCYISSGTWSLMGVELDRPIVTERALELNYTNEGGVGDTIRLLKNISGLWLIQECRRSWNAHGRNFSWDDLLRLAAAAPALQTLIDPDHASFLAPADMPAAIRSFCQRTSQSPPADEGAMVRCAIESLALRYRQVLQSLEELTGGPISTIHIVGGGTQNRLLCQATADACQRPVVAGPMEATAIGNVMMQAIAAGLVGSIAEAREVVRKSFDVVEYLPRNSDTWNEAHAKFEAVQAAGRQ